MKVVIDEALELAKKFSSAEAPAFLNGILDAAQKKLEALNAATYASMCPSKTAHGRAATFGIDRPRSEVIST